MTGAASADGAARQVALDPGQLRAFYHDDFVRSQVADFDRLTAALRPSAPSVVDLGGGVGHFAAALRREIGATVLVIDSDPRSVEACAERGVPAELGDVAATRAADGADFATLNMLLHHLVGGGFDATARLQRAALANLARPGGPRWLFVNEYVYESHLATGFGSAAIYAVTASRPLSALGRVAARLAPSLRANTLGVGVRFRAAARWRALFGEAGWRVAGQRRGADEPISAPRRLALALRSCRRDSFLLARA